MPDTTPFYDPHGVEILIATDDDITFSVLEQQLGPEGYRLTRVLTPKALITQCEQKVFPIVIVEDSLEGASGLELMEELQASHPMMLRLLFKRTFPAGLLSQAVKSGTLFRYINKPWFREDLLITLKHACRHHELATQNAYLQNQNIQLNLARTESLNALNAPPPSTALTRLTPAKPTAEWWVPPGLSSPVPPGIDLAMRAFIRSLYAFHPNIGNTAARTVAVCRSLCSVLELGPDDSADLVWAAALHDVALLEIDRNLVRRWLRDPEKCTDLEIAEIQKHPQGSQHVLRSFSYFKRASEIIRSHHESWDGMGYPDKLIGDSIPWLARLVGVAIAYCGIHAPSIHAMAEIEEQAGSRFDPDAITALSKAVPITVLPRGQREILLIELKPDMVLARDIFNAHGFLLLPEGSTITQSSIIKLWGVNRAAPIDPFVLVYS
jgi:response regulator RpfG family c-di-GMP phosphodiesterase